MPWGEADLIAQVRELLPEGEPVNLQDHGITELPLEALNARLEPMGYRIHASGRRDATRAVACIDRKGQAIAYTHFELQRFPRERR